MTLEIPGKWEPVLLGLMGSHAYGLNHADSDEDYLGVFQKETADLLGLDPPEQTYVGHDPDVQYHELGKFCRLALGGNPTILELLWLPEYITQSATGKSLVGLRQHFLSDRVRDSFGGYAKQQVERMKRNAGESRQAKTEKNIRHMFRLLREGRELITTGEMTLKVEDPEELRALGRMPYEEVIVRFETELEAFKVAKGILPPQPNKDTINGWLVDTRLMACPPDPRLLEQLENAKEALRLVKRSLGVPGTGFVL